MTSNTVEHIHYYSVSSKPSSQYKLYERLFSWIIWISSFVSLLVLPKTHVQDYLLLLFHLSTEGEKTEVLVSSSSVRSNGASSNS